jgi:hypothetical protein
MLEVLLGLRRDLSNSSFPLEFNDELPGCAHPVTIGQSAVVEEGILDKPQLHRFLQFLGWPEGDLLTRLDLDSPAGRRVPSHPGRPLPRLENAETGQADFVAVPQTTAGQRDQIAQHGLSLILCDVMAVGQRGGEVLERDGRLGDGSFGWCGGVLCSGFLGRGDCMVFPRWVGLSTVSICHGRSDSSNPTVRYAFVSELIPTVRCQPYSGGYAKRSPESSTGVTGSHL